ncbi:MAG TPA: radical SAM protein [Methanosarcinaceae archaeon]|nr:radical SAM protein [Methanosarcinaceae archaeon]
MKYYLYKNPIFKVYAVVENGRVRIKTSGVASSLMKPMVSGMLEIFDDKKPAKVEDDRLIFSTWMPPIPSTAFSRSVSNQIKCLRGNMVPEQVTISITEECPNNCIHCALPDTKNKDRLTPEFIKDVIDQSLNMGTTLVIFDGGEPLVYEGLEDMIHHVDTNRAVSAMFTSGVGLTPERARSLKKAGLYMVSVSFDSANEEGHDFMRGRAGVFNDAISAVKNLIDAGLLVNVYVVISPRNIDELDDFYILARDLGAHELSFYEIVPTGRWIDHESEILSPDDHRKLDDFVARVDTMDGPRVFSIPHVMKTTGCFAGRKWLHITPQGDVLPCACIPISFGNIHEDTLKSVWKKIRKDPAYNADSCLMRDAEFRKLYLDIEGK